MHINCRANSVALPKDNLCVCCELLDGRWMDVVVQQIKSFSFNTFYGIFFCGYCGF